MEIEFIEFVECDVNGYFSSTDRNMLCLPLKKSYLFFNKMYDISRQPSVALSRCRRPPRERLCEGNGR